MFGIKKKFKMLSRKHCALIAAFGAVIILIPSAVDSACNARCDEYNAFNQPKTVNNQVQTVNYQIFAPVNTEIFVCFRIWIMDGLGIAALVDESETETWTYKRALGAQIECLYNGGVFGASLPGVNVAGPAFDITCASDCQEDPVDPFGPVE